MTVSIKTTKTGMIDGRSKNRNDYYDSEEFYKRWFSDETVESIALDCGVTIEAVRKAAIYVRGYPTKTQVKRRLDQTTLNFLRYYTAKHDQREER